MEELSVFIPWEGAAGKTVLVAEDNEINAEIIKFQMEDMGFSVERASNGEEAFDMFEKSEEGKYSVIIMDIMMPVMDGHEAAGKIRSLERNDSKIPIIALTANAFDPDLLSGTSAEMSKYLIKPYSKDDLYNSIVELMEV